MIEQFSIIFNQSLKACFSAYARVARKDDFDTAEELEKEFHELWNDPKEEQEIEKQVEEEIQEIEKQNEAFEDGKATFDEQLNPISLIPKEEFEDEKLGAEPAPVPAAKRYATGAIDVPEELRVLSEEDQAYLDNIYAELSRCDIPDSFDARDNGK